MYQTTYYYSEGNAIVFRDVAGSMWRVTKTGETISVIDYDEVQIIKKHVHETVVDKEAFKQASDAYVAEERKLYMQFKNDLFEDLGITGNPKAELLFEKAWDSNHCSGFETVYAAAVDLVDLIL